MRLTRQTIALVATLAMAFAMVLDNPTVCADDAACASTGSCPGQSDRGAAPHQCLLCPCHTPVAAQRAEPASSALDVVQSHLPEIVRALVSADLPAPLTPPPTNRLA